MNTIFNKRTIIIAIIALCFIVAIVFCCVNAAGSDIEDEVSDTITEIVTTIETETETEIITETVTTETEIVTEEITTVIETETETETEVVYQEEPVVIEYEPEPEPAYVEPEPVAVPTGEYPVATYVWNYLHAAGYNDYVTAGIIGNMMAEAGGLTLNLQWDIYGGGGAYYGLCQWYYAYFPEIYGASLDGQLEGLLNSIEYQFSVFGGMYGYSYANFLNIQNSSEAAIVFAQVYERCGSAYVQLRAGLAETAYNYFTGQ